MNLTDLNAIETSNITLNYVRLEEQHLQNELMSLIEQYLSFAICNTAKMNQLLKKY